jgi:hypothetical protein
MVDKNFEVDIWKICLEWYKQIYFDIEMSIQWIPNFFLFSGKSCRDNTISFCVEKCVFFYKNNLQKFISGHHCS